jgi:hypothetical protein
MKASGVQAHCGSDQVSEDRRLTRKRNKLMECHCVQDVLSVIQKDERLISSRSPKKYPNIRDPMEQMGNK